MIGDALFFFAVMVMTVIAVVLGGIVLVGFGLFAVVVVVACNAIDLWETFWHRIVGSKKK